MSNTNDSDTPNNLDEVQDNLVTVDSDEFSQVISDQSVVLLDVRTPEEFNDQHIAGAINIDFYAHDFRDQIENLDKDKRYAIYCRSGSRSGSTLQIMGDSGFAEVTNLDGGILNYDFQNNCIGNC